MTKNRHHPHRRFRPLGSLAAVLGLVAGTLTVGAAEAAEVSGLEPAAAVSLPDCAETTTRKITADDVDFTETRERGYYEFTPGGLRVWTLGPADYSAKSAGYIPVDFPLSEVGTPSYDYQHTSGLENSLQLTVDRDGDRATTDDVGNLVWEPAEYGPDTFWSLKVFGITGAGEYPSWGTLAVYQAANPNAQVIAVGYSLGSYSVGDGIIRSLTAGCTIYDFTYDLIPECESLTVQKVTAAEWDLSETRAQGSVTFTPFGVEVKTWAPAGYESKAAGYVAVDFPLTAVGVPSYENIWKSGANNSLQLTVDRDGDPDTTEDIGNLVWEPSHYGPDIWWSWWEYGISGAGGYPSWGALEDYATANPNARVVRIGFSQGSGSVGESLVKNITAGCTVYDFTYDLMETCAGVTVQKVTAEEWDLTETRTQGSVVFTPKGVKATTWDPAGSQSKAAGYIPVDFPLTKVGTPSYDNTNISGANNSLQLTVDRDGDPETTGDIRNLVWEPAEYGPDIFWSLGDFGIGGAGEYPSWGTLEQYATANLNARVVRIGFSLGSGSVGENLVKSITAGCTTYDFTYDAIPACTSTSVVYLNPSNHHTADFGNTRATGHWRYTGDGLKMWTEGASSTDKVAGYWPVSVPLAQAGVPDFEYVNDAGFVTKAAMNLGLDINGDGVAEAYLVYEPGAYDPGMFWSSYDFGVGGGAGYASYAALEDYLEAHPTATITQVGFSLGSGVHGSGVLKSLTFGCVEYIFNNPAIEACTTSNTVFVTPTSLVPISFAETRATGSYTFVANGLQMATTGTTSTDKVAGYIPVDFPLGEVGVPSFSYTVTPGVGSGTPASLQLVVDVDANGTPDGYLAYEPASYGADKWWSNAFLGIPSGLGYNSYGTLTDLLGANPNARVMAVGFSLGSGVFAAGVLHSITGGCTTYEFSSNATPVQILLGNRQYNATVPLEAAIVVGGTGDRSGTVVVKNEAGAVVDTLTVDANGNASVNLGILSAGDYVYTVEYSGNATHASAASAPATLRVYFHDYPSGSAFYDDVQWLVSLGITRGATADGVTFAPKKSIQRQALAAWLYRYLHDGATAPACTSPPFTDVTVSNEFCGEIAWLKTSGITTGYTDGSFHPGEPIARQALAAWFYRMANGTAPAPNCTTAPFVDVPVSTQFCKEIKWLKDTGITTGYQPENTFKREQYISREAVAAWLHRYDLLGS